MIFPSHHVCVWSPWTAHGLTYAISWQNPDRQTDRQSLLEMLVYHFTDEPQGSSQSACLSAPCSLEKFLLKESLVYLNRDHPGCAGHMDRQCIFFNDEMVHV